MIDDDSGQEQSENPQPPPQAPKTPPKERRYLTDPDAVLPETARSEHSPFGELGTPKLPFNDFKHPPTRPEIDLLLGVMPSAELRRFEHQLELMEPLVNWAMHWYQNETGWGYRASYKARVLCVLHFYRGFFTVTLSIPIDDEQQYHTLKELTPGLRKAFEHYTLSTKMKWITFHVRTAKDVNAILAIMRLKYADLRKKTGQDKG